MRRYGCDLAKVSEAVGLERPGGDLDEFGATAEAAREAFHDLKERAAVAGIAMDDNVIEVTPIPALAQAISFAVTAGSQDAE